MSARPHLSPCVPSTRLLASAQYSHDSTPHQSMITHWRMLRRVAPGLSFWHVVLPLTPEGFLRNGFNMPCECLEDGGVFLGLSRTMTLPGGLAPGSPSRFRVSTSCRGVVDEPRVSAGLREMRGKFRAMPDRQQKGVSTSVRKRTSSDGVAVRTPPYWQEEN